MAYYPCSVGPHYNPLKNVSVYLGWGAGADIQRFRLRLCPSHFGSVQEHLSEFEVNPEDGTLSGGDAAVANCLSCGQPLNELGLNLFITAYPAQNERKDYWAHIHTNCRVPEYLVVPEASASA